MKINREPDKEPKNEKKGKAPEEKQVYRRAAPAQQEEPPRKAYDVMKDEPLFAGPAHAPDEEEEEERPRRRFPFGLVILAVFLALVVYGGVKVYGFYSEVDGGKELGAEQAFTVEQGSSVAAIAAALKEQGFIQYDWLFRLYVSQSPHANDLQYGTFMIRPGMSYNELISALSVEPKRETVTLTFPEGSTCFAIADKMEEAGLCTADEFLACANGEDGSDFSQYEFWTLIPDNENRIMKCEGYLFPETYEFFTDDTVYNYVNTFYKEFDSRTAGLMDTINEKGTTLNDVVILASFIQEEAGKPEEDAKVSAVFHNRLESTDPDWADHKLESNASSDIQNPDDNNYLYNWIAPYFGGWDNIPQNYIDAYNTYSCSGLPAGAITNPGYDAIEAALNPDEEFMAEGYYFFVTDRETGEYYYAKTADEHYANCVMAGWA